MKILLKKIVPSYLIDKLKNYIPSFVYKKISYSQSGEDLIFEHIFNALKINTNINYCDIGANAPWQFSNTARFYKNNKKDYIGVLVEPDPMLANILKRKRARDVVVNKGIKSADESASVLEFYQISSNTLNTFSYQEAQYYETLGYKIKNKLNIEVININELLEEYFSNKELHLLSVDVEGLDYEILKTMDFKRFTPICICVETINFVPDGMAIKNNQIVDLMHENGYFEYAFTGINSIFIYKEKWKNR